MIAFRLRNHESIEQDMQFSHGDQVILDVPYKFSEKNRDSNDFLVCRKVQKKDEKTIDKYKAYMSGAILALMLVFVAFSIRPLFVCALAAVFAMVVSGCATTESAKKGVRLSVVLTIVGAFGLGNAIGKHNIALVMGESLVHLFEPWGQTGLLLALSICIVALGIIFHGTAVVALMFPMCMQVCKSSGIPQHQMAAVLCITVTCQMLSPVSYNTNLMAYAACPEYEFMDFVKVGAPLVVLILGVGIPMCQFWYPVEVLEPAGIWGVSAPTLNATFI